MGYVLVAFLASGPMQVTAVVFYLAAYLITMAGAFGVIAILSGKERDSDRLEDFHGLYFRRPWLAGIFTAMLLSLAGIPFTAGFIGKFYIVAAGIGSFLWIPVLSLINTSVIGLFYYLRVLVAMYTPLPGVTEAAEGSISTGICAVVILIILLLGLGAYPGPVLEMITAMCTFG